MNQETYRTVIRKFNASVSRRREIVINRQWFLQDGATPHTANATQRLNCWHRNLVIVRFLEERTIHGQLIPQTSTHVTFSFGVTQKTMSMLATR